MKKWNNAFIILRKMIFNPTVEFNQGWRRSGILDKGVQCQREVEFFKENSYMTDVHQDYSFLAAAAVASVMSNSVQSHRQQPTRLCHPWDSPGKNTGVGCHFLLQCKKGKSESEVVQLCPTLSNPMDCSLRGFS